MQTDDFYDLPREFHILGACLFHKGLLVTSHLDRKQLADVYVWCKTTKLLKLTKNQPLQRLVTWQEIFSNNDSTTVEHRHFLLVVGRDHQVPISLIFKKGSYYRKGQSRPVFVAFLGLLYPCVLFGNDWSRPGHLAIQI